MRSAREDYPNRCCMTCDWFKLKGQPGRREGRGLCTMYVEPQDWDWDRCIIYTPAATMGDRLRYLEAFQNKREQDMKKIDTKAGEIWKTAKGHRVKIITGRDASLIETEYVDGPVDGYRGINFDAASGTSITGGDALMEREV